MILESLQRYDSLRSSASSSQGKIYRPKGTNIDLVSSDAINKTVDNSILALCHVVIAMPMGNAPYYFGTAFGASLAAQHLNAGDGFVVPEMDGLNDRCAVRFTVEFVETGSADGSAALEAILNVLRREERNQTNISKPLPCAFIGTATSTSTVSTSIFTGIAGYPQVSPMATSSALSDRTQHPLFARPIPSDDGLAIPAAQYFSEIIGIKRLAVLYDNNAYGNAYVRALKRAVRQMELDVEFFDVPPTKKVEDWAKAVTDLKNTGRRYFFAIMAYGQVDYGRLMTEAYRREIAGTGRHTWIFADYGVPVSGNTYEKGSEVALASKGVAMIKSSSGRAGMPIYDRLTEAWSTLNNKDDIEYIKSMHPSGDPESIGYDSATDPDSIGYDPATDFDFTTPGWAEPFIYDAMAMLGLAACNASATDVGSERFSAFGGAAHYDAIIGTQFSGTTGTVRLDAKTGSRDPDSALFIMHNYVGVNYGDNVTFTETETDIFQSGSWKNVSSFVYADGTLDPHPDLDEVDVDMQYIGVGVRGACLGMACIIVLLSIGFAAWTHTHRRNRAVRSSQPIFLLLLCLGIFILDLTIVPLSFDDEIASVNQCTVACILSPWFFCIGFCISFSALFSKLWRVNKIFHNPTMKRIKVTHTDVIIPLFIFLSANILVLSLWTTLAPRSWERGVTRYDLLDRVAESEGKCGSEKSLPYTLTLAVINVSLLLLTMTQAYKAREISIEFAETKYIALAISICSLVCGVSAPFLFVSASSGNRVSFLFSSIVVLVISSALLLFIFVPKIRFAAKRDISSSIKKVVQNFVKKERKERPVIPTISTLNHQLEAEGLKVEMTPQKLKGLMIHEVEWKKEKMKYEDRVRELEMLLEKHSSSTPREVQETHTFPEKGNFILA